MPIFVPVGEFVIGQRRSHKNRGFWLMQGGHSMGEDNSDVLRDPGVPSSRSPERQRLRSTGGLVGRRGRHVRNDVRKTPFLQHRPRNHVRTYHHGRGAVS